MLLFSPSTEHDRENAQSRGKLPSRHQQLLEPCEMVEYGEAAGTVLA